SRRTLLALRPPIPGPRLPSPNWTRKSQSSMNDSGSGKRAGRSPPAAAPRCCRPLSEELPADWWHYSPSWCFSCLRAERQRIAPMTEAEWLACTDPWPMLEFVLGKASDRKLRLFACACCRHYAPFGEDRKLQEAVALTERHADGMLPKAEYPRYNT